MNGLALYAGNGGLEAALHLVLPGYRTICAVERRAYAAAAFVEWLEKAGLGACPVWDDAATFDPIPWRGLVDIVSAGFPCQPYSAAGKGLRDSDQRDGWPHVFRIVQCVMPPIFWAENVAAIVTRGRHSFKSDLESLGYRVAAGIYSAAEVGAPHLRERLFILGFLANSEHSGSELGDADGLSRDRRPEIQGRRQERAGHERAAPNGRYQWPWPAGCGAAQYAWEKPRIIESGMGGTTHGVGARNEQLLNLGNGVVPVAGALAFVALWQKLSA